MQQAEISDALMDEILGPTGFEGAYRAAVLHLEAHRIQPDIAFSGGHFHMWIDDGFWRQLVSYRLPVKNDDLARLKRYAILELVRCHVRMLQRKECSEPA